MKYFPKIGIRWNHAGIGLLGLWCLFYFGVSCFALGQSHAQVDAVPCDCEGTVGCACSKPPSPPNGFPVHIPITPDVRYPKRWVEPIAIAPSGTKMPNCYRIQCFVLLEEVNRYDLWTTEIKGFECVR